MINIKKAEEKFNIYVGNYNKENKKVIRKIIHTYGVEQLCEIIAESIGLDEEKINLAKLIGLLHDIGRFEQAKKYDNFSDLQTIDHADYGAQILFKNNLIREFIEEDTYDQIIYKAVKNHNKYKIEDGLTEDEILFSKIIRDADKLDNVKMRITEDLNNYFEVSVMSKQKISDKVYNDFIDGKCVNVKDRQNYMDEYVCILAFIYDLCFEISMKYMYANNCIDKLIDKLNYEDKETNNRMNKIRETSKKYIKQRI